VIEHLESHLHEHGLPEDDERSRRIVAQMQRRGPHGSEAREAGGRELPRPVRELMRRTAQLMTRTAIVCKCLRRQRFCYKSAQLYINQEGA